jgi:hypothetical protein
MFESLENRRLMSGNVSVTFTGGLLSIIGDNKANQIDVEGGTNLSGVTVTGFNGTTVNGQPSVFTNTGLPPDTRISLGNGDDVVVVHPASGVTPTVAKLDIDTANGNDVVALVGNNAPNLNFSVNVNTGNGDDIVVLQDVISFTDLNVSLGNGDDLLALDGGVQALGNIKVDGGRGNDTLINGNLLSAGGTLDILNFEHLI